MAAGSGIIAGAFGDAGLKMPPFKEGQVASA